MSVFSIIKRGRQAAKEHRAEQAEKQKKEAEKPPYKHIPKHAAIDALSGGPAGWKEHDRVRIVEENRRRSAMAASGMSTSGTATPAHAGIPRVHSALSHVSYPSASASPIVRLPRNYSYSSMPPGWTRHARELSYSPVDTPSMSPKGKEVERVIDSSRTSRSSSKVSTGRIPLQALDFVLSADAGSPVGSSNDSSSSQDDLEMKPMRPTISIPPSASVTRTNRPSSAGDSIHRLHPAHSRRVSDPNQSLAPPRGPLAPRTISLSGIPPVPALPPMQFGPSTTTPEVSSSAASTASSVTMVPVASSTSLAANAAPQVASVTALKVEEAVAVRQEPVAAESPSDDEAVPADDLTKVSVVGPTPTAVSSPVKSGRRTSKTTRFAELETIQSNVSATIEVAAPAPKDMAKETEQKKPRLTSMATALPTSFDEDCLPEPQEIVLPPRKPGKLTKRSGAGVNLAKKNRWSLRSSKSAAVAV